MSFIKESVKEFDHIVWPTSEETKKYFFTVVSMITILTVFLFIVGTAFSVGLFTAKTQFTQANVSSTPTSSTPASDLKLDNIQTNTVTASGAKTQAPQTK